MYLIEMNGEEQVVETLRGCDGCKVIAENVPEKPDFATKFKNGKWEIDAAQKEEAALAVLPLRERHKRAKKEAKAELIDDLEATGVLNPQQAKRLRDRLA
jgi:hypothetical protein